MPVLTLDELDAAAVARFIHRWYDELHDAGVYETASKAHAARARLHDAILTAAHPNHVELRKMAGRPLLLTMMAQDALDVLRAKQRKGGACLLQARYAGQTHFEMKTPGKPSRWNTLHVLYRFEPDRAAACTII